MGEYSNQGISNYYNQESQHGSYQYQTLDALVSTFLMVYVGENKIISKANRQDVFFFGRRALQEMNYDVLRSKKTLEFELDNRMYVPMPHDYVNHTDVFYTDSSGIKHPLFPARDTQNPFRPKTKDLNVNAQDLDEWWETMKYYNVFQETEYNGLEGEDSKTLEAFQATPSHEDQVADFNYNDGHSEFALGQRYGLGPEHAQINGSYFFDYANGHIYFSSGLVGSTIVLDYITDGLADDGDALIPKLAEEAFYKCVAYSIVSTGANYSPATIQQLKKERFAELRKAKIRLSNYKTQELTQVMRGKSKWIK